MDSLWLRNTWIGIVKNECKVLASADVEAYTIDWSLSQKKSVMRFSYADFHVVSVAIASNLSNDLVMSNSDLIVAR